MKISRHELDQLIEKEINEIFGFGKKAPSKEYPASELATLIKGLDDASKMSGAKLSPSQREAIVDELMGVLEDQGFVVKENERLYTGEKDVVVTHQNAPKLKVFLDTIAQKSPKVFKQLLGLFNRSALDISPVVKDIIPSITTVAEPEPDEDQTSTIVTEPAKPDEDQTATIKAEPVAAPDEDEEDSKWDAALDKVQASLDVLGAVGLWPPAMAVSKPATIASLLLNMSRGMYGWALFDLVSLTPIVGDAMKAGKLGKGAKGAAAAARAKKFGTLRKLVKAGHAGKARTAAKGLKNARAAVVLEKGAEGIVELIPDDLLKKLIDAKTDKGDPMMPWMIAQLGKVPGLGDKVENLQRTWQVVVSLAATEEAIPAVAEHKELDRMKVLAGIK